MTTNRDQPIPLVRGIGNDIIEISRIRQALEKHGEHFTHKLFTDSEQNYCYEQNDPAIRFAGRFAAKEAIAKALGTGFGHQLSWLDIEISNNELGKPHVTLCPSLLQYFNNPRILLSISHCQEYANAVALWLG